MCPTRCRWSRIWWWNTTRVKCRRSQPYNASPRPSKGGGFCYKWLMTNLTRRSLLSTAAASLAARILPAQAGSVTFKHGAFEVTVVSDGHLVLPTSFLAPGAPPEDRAALLKATGQTAEQYESPTNIT